MSACVKRKRSILLFCFVHTLFFIVIVRLNLEPNSYISYPCLKKSNYINKTKMKKKNLNSPGSSKVRPELGFM